MEHRWGERLEFNLAVQVSCLHPRLHGSGLLVNLSMSGGLLAVDLPVRMLSLVQIVIEAAPWCKESTMLSAYVTRTHGDRIGVEWSTFAPREVIDTLRAGYRHCVPRVNDRPSLY